MREALVACKVILIVCTHDEICRGSGGRRQSKPDLLINPTLIRPHAAIDKPSDDGVMTESQRLLVPQA